MKTIKTLILISSLVGLLSCGKEPEEINTLDVEKYIELLKTNEYDLAELPAFTYHHIPELLKYRNETQVITNFPHNMISSLWRPDCELGMYVLWTIESIRAVAIDSKYLTGRFPSQNPIVQKREEPFDMEYGNEVNKIIAQAYYDWWENNKNKEFHEFKNIDPLMKTEYRWH